MNECEICRFTYTKKQKNQTTCSKICQDKKKTIEANKRWVESKSRTSSPGASNRFARSRLYDSGIRGFFKKFNACRG